MRLIELTKGRSTAVDDADYEWLTAWKWHLTGNGKYAGRMHRRKLVYMHRVITQADEGVLVDHADGDGLNNQRSNLRTCDASQNQRNKRKSNGKSSRFKGVWKDWRPLQKPWVAYIKPSGATRTWLGYYATEEEAAMAYDKAAREIFGEYAKLNFPDSEVAA